MSPQVVRSPAARETKGGSGARGPGESSAQAVTHTSVAMAIGPVIRLILPCSIAPVRSAPPYQGKARPEERLRRPGVAQRRPLDQRERLGLRPAAGELAVKPLHQPGRRDIRNR